MNALLFILVVILLIAAVYLVPIAFSTVYAFRGRIENDHFMIRLKNTNFLDIELNSRTGQFGGGTDPVKRWEVKESKEVDKEEVRTTYSLGGVWPVYTAMKVVIPINTIDVKRPTQVGQKISYEISTRPITTRTPPRFLVHGFETTPVETKGGSGKVGDCKIDDDSNLVALITEVLQVTFEIFNPYLAFVKIPKEVGQGLMVQLNGTLQSTARQITAKFSYNEIIKAIVEEGDDETKSIKARFGEMFIALANINLEKYGLRIIEIDLLDHSLDPDMAKSLQSPQKAYYEAQATITNAEAKKKEKELHAEGDAAEIRELLKATGQDKQLASLEINRRGTQRASEGVGREFKGQFLTVNIGGGPVQPGPMPAVTVGSVTENRPAEKEAKETGGPRPHTRGGEKIEN